MTFIFPLQKTGLLIPFLFTIGFGQAQTTEKSLVSQAEQKLILEYQQKIKDGLLLNTGSEYYYADAKLTEHPFLKSDQPFKGSVRYFGVEYLDIPLQYDLLRDELVLANNPALRIRLVREKITSFTLEGRPFFHLNFQNITEGLTTEGFYEELLPGKMSLLARRRKKVKEILQPEGITYQVLGADEFFIRNESALIPINSRSQFLHQLGEHRKKIAAKLRQDKIKYRHNPEFYLLMAMRYYNQPNTL